MTQGYKVFTRRFDRVLEPPDLARQLAAMAPTRRHSLDQAWEAFAEGTLVWRTTGGLRAVEAAARLRDRLPDRAREETVVSILVDHSGSMRGQNMLLAATAVDIAITFLSSISVKVEVLGFTTRAWRGGRSRLLWRFTGRRRDPGRLNDLLHLVYVTPGEPGRSPEASSYRNLIHMLRQDILKENIDGEALEWAAERLRVRSEPRRVLVMISDGAPVDDSTLRANGPSYLADHLRDVVARLEGELTLGQLQIGEEWPSVFGVSAVALTPDAVATGLIDLLERALVHAGPD